MQVEVTENMFIPLKDGTKIAARMWRPTTTSHVPAILEYIPYRKRDGTRARDTPMHYWFAEHGTAAIRVDLRGSGESHGVMHDEYQKIEQDDAVEVIDWISKQEWCNGSVGMMGKSWGGFNSLQVAARNPPALKAIITLCFTDDRYADDVHYMGGCLLSDNLWWGAIMLAYQSTSPDPKLVLDWKQQWIQRIEQLPFFAAIWAKHQTRDAYWKHGSVCENYSDIKVPVLAISGWVDSYKNAIPRLLENINVPKQGIIGPWAHIYPHDGSPGPAIGFLQEAQRWWDKWLHGEDNDIMEEPMMRAYITDSARPITTSKFTPGKWIGEKSWPSATIVPKIYFMNGKGTLDTTEENLTTLNIKTPFSFGQACGEWMGTGCAGDLQPDQRQDDGAALTFTTSILRNDLVVLGAPEVAVLVQSDSPVAQLCVRLCEVFPDGASKRVSYGILNLTHRDSHEFPTPLEPNKQYLVKIKLNDCGYRFAKGNRIRVSLSTHYWPLVWPAPYHAMLTIITGVSSLSLPIRQTIDTKPVVFEKPEKGPDTPMTIVDKGHVSRYCTRDHVTNEVLYVTEGVGGLFGEGIIKYNDVDITEAHTLKRELRIKEDDPLSANYVITQSYRRYREGWDTLVISTSSMTSDLEHFYLKGQVKVTLNGDLVRERVFDEKIQRNLV
jgi:hypothetical protein